MGGGGGVEKCQNHSDVVYERSLRELPSIMKRYISIFEGGGGAPKSFISKKMVNVTFHFSRGHPKASFQK